MEDPHSNENKYNLKIDRDGKLGRDPRFQFEDRVMEIVESGDVEELHNFLNNNLGKSLSFSHYKLHKTPHKLALDLHDGPMLLALIQRQEEVKNTKMPCSLFLNTMTIKLYHIF